MLILDIFCILLILSAVFINIFLFHSVVKFYIDDKACYVYVPRCFKKQLGIISERLRG